MKLNLIANNNVLVSYNFGDKNHDEMADFRIAMEKAVGLGFTLGSRLGTGIIKVLPTLKELIAPLVEQTKRDITPIVAHVKGASAKLNEQFTPVVEFSNERFAEDGDLAPLLATIKANFGIAEKAFDEANSSTETAGNIADRLVGVHTNNLSVELELTRDENDVIGLSWFRRKIINMKTGVSIDYDYDQGKHYYVVDIPSYVGDYILCIIGYIPQLVTLFPLFAAMDRAMNPKEQAVKALEALKG